MKSLFKSKLIGDVHKKKEDIIYIGKNKPALVNTLNTVFDSAIIIKDSKAKPGPLSITVSHDNSIA